MLERAPETSTGKPVRRKICGALLAGVMHKRPSARFVALLYGLAGLSMGLALAHPAFWIGAWFSAACLAAALTWSESTLAVLVGATAAHAIPWITGVSWAKSMNELLFDLSPLQHDALLLGQALAWALPVAIPIALAHALFHQRVGVCWWLPVAWGAGELVRFEWVTINIGDWLCTQWTVGPVLRAVGHLGWWPTHILCLFAASCLGQALATRQRTVTAPCVLVVIGLWMLPPLPETGTELLRGIVAVHTNSTVALPHADPTGDGDEPVELIIWPETAFHLLPVLREGPGLGAHLPILVPGSEATQLLGLETQLLGGGRQNSVVVADANGRVVASRAKKLLLPAGERRFMGLGRDRFQAGHQPALLNAAGRAIIPLICGEFLSRALVAEGVQAGGELMVVVARDHIMVNDRAKRQVLAVQLLRSVEYGIPSVRASYGGWASFISSDGRVLALSGDTKNGLLRWDPEHGARDVDFYGRTLDTELDPVESSADIMVLYARDAPQYRTRCPEGRCKYVAIEDFRCPRAPVSTVIVAGHGSPPSYLSQSHEKIGEALRCLSPQLVVIDTCFGASIELLGELDSLATLVVAAPFLLPPAGLEYGPEFFEPGPPKRRARAIEGPPSGQLLRWSSNAAELLDAKARAAAMDASALRANLVRRDPAYVGIELDTGRVLVPFDWRRMQGGQHEFKRVRARNSGSFVPRPGS